jgi:hypothetical protein
LHGPGAIVWYLGNEFGEGDQFSSPGLAVGEVEKLEHRRDHFVVSELVEVDQEAVMFDDWLCRHRVVVFLVVFWLFLGKGLMKG